MIDNRPVTEAENDENDSNDIQDADIDQLKGNKLINEESIAFVSIEKSHENPWIDDDYSLTKVPLCLSVAIFIDKRFVVCKILSKDFTSIYLFIIL